MNSNELKEKLSYYYNLREKLRATNIDEAVNIKLEEMREKVAEEVKTEINTDIDKCTHYIEILDILVKEQCDIEDRNVCAAVKEVENEVKTEEVNENVEEISEEINNIVEGGDQNANI